MTIATTCCNLACKRMPRTGTVRMRRRATAGKNSRAGVTLLEVLLASVLLAGSLATLAQLGDSGARMAILSELQSQAAVRCETKLNEIQLGLETPKASVSRFRDAGWLWSAEWKHREDGLTQATVAVWRDGKYADASRVQMTRLISTAPPQGITGFGVLTRGAP